MPELSRFYGIVIKMYFDDHDPSHFHAEYAEDEAVISIETLAIIEAACDPGRWVWLRSGRHCTKRS